MQDIITYIVVFLIIIIFTWIYYGKKDKSKIYSLGKKYYSYGSIDILIEKINSEIKNLIIKPSFKESHNPELNKIKIELIDPETNKTIVQYELNDVIKLNITSSSYLVDFNSFKTFLKIKNHEKSYFRFVIYGNETKKLKSVILSLNKKWNVFVPDTGNYN
jgi:hypothetical protein